MAMEDVVEQLEREKADLSARMEIVSQMLSLARNGSLSTAPRAKQREPRQRKTAATADRKTQIGPGTLEKVQTAIQEWATSGKSFVESIPGSFTTKDIVGKTGLSVGTVRKVMARMMEENQIKRADRLSWRALGDKPQGRTDVYVLEPPTQERTGWRRSAEGAGAEAELTNA